jgi:hypothetical protein
MDHSDAWTADDADRVNPYYTDEHRKMWEEKPETLYQHRHDVSLSVSWSTSDVKQIMHTMNNFFDSGFTITNSKTSNTFRDLVIDATKKKLGVLLCQLILKADTFLQKRSPNLLASSHQSGILDVVVLLPASSTTKLCKRTTSKSSALGKGVWLVVGLVSRQSAVSKASPGTV